MLLESGFFSNSGNNIIIHERGKTVCKKLNIKIVSFNFLRNLIFNCFNSLIRFECLIFYFFLMDKMLSCTVFYPCVARSMMFTS